MGNIRGDGDDGGERRSRRRGAARAAAATPGTGAATAATATAASTSVTRTTGATARRWEVHYRKLVAFKKKRGHCRVPARYAEDAPLGRWVRNQRRRYKRRNDKFNAAAASPGDGATPPEWIRRLEEIGFEWDGRAANEAERWEEWYRMLKAYKRRHGHCLVPQRYVHGGERLGRWVSRQRHKYKEEASALSGDGATHRERIRRLNEIGFAWDGRPANAAKRRKQLSQKLHTCQAERGTCHVPQADVRGPGSTRPAAATASTSSARGPAAFSQRSTTTRRVALSDGAAGVTPPNSRAVAPTRAVTANRAGRSASSGNEGTVLRASACPAPADLAEIAPPLRKRARLEVGPSRLGRQGVAASVRATHKSDKRPRIDAAVLSTRSRAREKRSSGTGSSRATCPVVDDGANESLIRMHDGVGDGVGGATVPDESPAVQRKRGKYEGVRRSPRLLGSAEKYGAEQRRSGDAIAAYDSSEVLTEHPDKSSFAAEGNRSSSWKRRLRSDRLANDAEEDVPCTEKAPGRPMAKRPRREKGAGGSVDLPLRVANGRLSCQSISNEENQSEARNVDSNAGRSNCMFNCCVGRRRDAKWLKEGSKVFALFPKELRWYWAKITSVTGKGTKRTFSVLYDDGERQDELSLSEVYAESEYDRLKGRSKSLEELYARACQGCDMCRKTNCGKCQGCDANSTSGPSKVCLFKICEKIPVEEAAHMFPFYLPTVKFLVRRSGNETGDPLAGLVIQTAEGNRYSRIEQHTPSYLSRAGTSCIEIQTDAVIDIYTNVFDVTLTTKNELTRDEYRNEVWSAEWMGPDFKKVVLTGKVTHQVESLVEINGQKAKDKFFVDFNSDELNERLRPFGQTVPSEETMTEEELKTGLSGFSSPWIVPNNVESDQEGRLTFEAMGFEFVVSVDESTICNGDGLFVTVRPLKSKTGTTKVVGKGLAKNKFVLKKGQCIDFGVYAPHHAGHLKLVALFGLKCVVTDGRCADYAWRCEAEPDYVYDVSDDRTGNFDEPHSVLAFVNEANEGGQATMFAKEDKAGAVHYLLGSPDEDISFDLDTPIELTTSYGAMYEPVRLRHDYGSAPAEVRNVLERNPYRLDILKDVGSMDHGTVVKSIKFFTTTYRSDLSRLPNEFRDRFFTVILTLHARMRDLTPPNQAPPSKQLMEAALRLYDAKSWDQLLRNGVGREAVQLLSSEALSGLVDEPRPRSLKIRLLSLWGIGQVTTSKR